MTLFAPYFLWGSQVFCNPAMSFQPEPEFAPFAFTDIESLSPSRPASPERGDAPRRRRRGAKGSRAVAGNQKNDPGKDTLKLRLELNLAVDISIKARVHGDVTLSLL
ncbi:hypothetical protein IW261DRAFT_1568282 [Armillaria novae-zelandiae]|uniref:Uncharacterized protein n=1 Tax=Armillaria novae-zelandiae TaxID=153914 RepID=A0AA39P010_9AGAR|nr:hypothetical protein IW261DRAFT_1568282 [Armillaria novae-zelandiae]